MKEFEHIDFDEIIEEYGLDGHSSLLLKLIKKAMKAAIQADRENRIKKKTMTMPVEIISRTEYESLQSLLNDLDSFFGKMNYNPEATNVIYLHNRITDALKKFRPSPPKQEKL